MIIESGNNRVISLLKTVDNVVNSLMGSVVSRLDSIMIKMIDQLNKYYIKTNKINRSNSLINKLCKQMKVMNSVKFK